MSGFASLGAALVAAAVGMFAAALASDVVLGWVRVSAADGNHSLFMFFNMIYGAVAGFVIGLVIAFLVPAEYTFWRAAGSAGVVVVAGVAAIVGVSRALGDVPPRVGGSVALVAVEVRWPDGTAERPRPSSGTETRLMITAASPLGIARTWEHGQLWLDEAEHVAGRWTVPGAVPLYSGRRNRAVEVRLDDASVARFDLPLPGRPGADHFVWSDWSAPPSAHRFEFRYRLVRPEDPVRSPTHENFGLSVHANQYLPRMRRKVLPPMQHVPVVLRYRGEPVRVEQAPDEGVEAQHDLSAVRSAMPIEGLDAVVVLDADHRIFLVVGDGEAVRVIHLADATTNASIFEITTDPARYRRHGFTFNEDPLVLGALERDRLYLLSGAILDTGALAVRPLPPAEGIEIVAYESPLGISPDRRHIVLRGYRTASGSGPVLAVIDLDGGGSYPVEVPESVRYSIGSLGPDWLLEEYDWVEESGGWRLVGRSPAIHP